jgi:hypothetical protein
MAIIKNKSGIDDVHPHENHGSDIWSLSVTDKILNA